MRLNTTSGIISFVKKIETDEAEFFKKLSERYDQDRELFLAFVKENNSNVTEVERAYYSVITDAIEVCFAFDMDADLYTFNNDPDVPADYQGILDKALQIEEKIIKFYTDATEQSGKLMADVPRRFQMIAKKRSNRLSKLKLLLEK
jgi:hypothetical protein